MSLISQFTPQLFQLVISLSIFLCYLIVSRKINQRKDLEKKYEESLNAILFLLATEDNHCRNNEESGGKSLRNTMRQYTKIETKLNWDSKFSKSNCLNELEKIKSKKINSKNFFIDSLLTIFLKVK